MKVGLIEPVYKDALIACNKHASRVFRERRKYLPVWKNANLGLLTVAAMMPREWEITYIHSRLEDIDYLQPLDLIAIGGMTNQADDMYTIARKFKQKGIYTVIGGIHASVLPEEAGRRADTVIAGEAEESFLRFIDDFCAGKPGRLYCAESEVDLKKSPVPRFDLLRQDYQNYPIQTTRGCPHNCKFCSGTRIYGKKFRHKDVDQVIEEILFLKSIKNDPFVIFVDDNMFVNKGYALDLLEKLIPLAISWQAQTDVSIGQEKSFLRLLHQAGCKELFIGFESLNPESLRDIETSGWKSNRISEYKSAVKNIQESGIRIFGAFILGLDKDTRRDYLRIRDFVVRNRILAQFSILTPLPGTELYEEFARAGRILEDKPWKYYNFVDCVIKHPRFSAEELEKTVADLYRETYSEEHYARVLSHLIRAHQALTESQT
jgi:radical SAM superfamily enzyme YgiQ (UPF0313 family)